MNKTIILTGGGTAGHVSVNLGLIPRLKDKGWTIHYVGSENGIEKDLIADFPYVSYHPVATGKFRRSFSFKSIGQNFCDIGRVNRGIRQARALISEIKPNIIFSKGGYVSVPVVIAGGKAGIPVISHESDLTPGLANKMSKKYAIRILTTFKETLGFLPADKGYYLGPIIRDQIKGGSQEEGLKIFGFDGNKPILLILGGSAGAVKVNEAIWKNLDSLLEKFDILHGTGRGKIKPELNRPGYHQVEYIKEEMNHALAMADLVVSRAGANAIFEFLYYKKPMLLIPYRAGSRGDQVDNSRVFVDAGYAETLNDQEMTDEDFRDMVFHMWENRDSYVKNEENYHFQDGLELICRMLEDDRKLD